MIEVVENSAQQLTLRLRGRGVSTTICTLNRETGFAEVSHLVFRLPYRRQRIALSSLLTPMVRRKKRKKEYRPMLEVRKGPTISLGGFSKTDALEAARAIRDFLKPPAKTTDAARGEQAARS